MRNRTLISVFIVLVVTAFIVLRSFSIYFIDIFAIGIMLAVGIEMSKAIGHKFYKPYIAIICAFPFAVYGAFLLGDMFLKNIGGLNVAFFFIVVLFLILLLLSYIIKSFEKERFFSTGFVIVYPMSLLIFLFALNRIGYGTAPILMVFAVSSLSDTFAYLVGSTLKGPKLCPKISPKKTISGAIGGLVGGMLGAGIVCFASYFSFAWTEPIAIKVPTLIIYACIAGLFGSVVTQVGDLTASVVKRKLEIKDYGTMLGKHGGMMDRVDGQIFNIVFLYFFFTIINLFV